MKQKIVTVTTGFKSSNDCQVEFETNIEKWLQVLLVVFLPNVFLYVPHQKDVAAR